MNLSSSRMNTLQIEKYLITLPVRNVGVYAADCLPHRISPYTALVVNTDPHNETGTHWVVFYLDENYSDGRGMIEYFDSYGQPPHLHSYQGFLRRNARRYLYNEVCLQSLDSQVCGHYCLLYLYYRTVCDLRMKDFVQLFGDSSTTHNDAAVKRLFQKIFVVEK